MASAGRNRVPIPFRSVRAALTRAAPSRCRPARETRQHPRGSGDHIGPGTLWSPTPPEPISTTGGPMPASHNYRTATEVRPIIFSEMRGEEMHGENSPRLSDEPSGESAVGAVSRSRSDRGSATVLAVWQCATAADDPSRARHVRFPAACPRYSAIRRRPGNADTFPTIRLPTDAVPQSSMTPRSRSKPDGGPDVGGVPVRVGRVGVDPRSKMRRQAWLSGHVESPSRRCTMSVSARVRRSLVIAAIASSVAIGVPGIASASPGTFPHPDPCAAGFFMTGLHFTLGPLDLGAVCF